MDVRWKIAVLVATFVLVVGFLLAVRSRSSDEYEPYQGPLASPGTPAAKPGTTRRVALNSHPTDYVRLKELGYNLVDVKPDESLVARVPSGMQALLWVGNFTCGEFELDYEAFTQAVQRFGRDPRVYGWYLSDEPNSGECPRVAEEIRRRAAYLRQHAPGQVSFISLTDWPMSAVAPARVGVDIIGLDPYPCKGSARTRAECNIDAIDRMVRLADDAGIPRNRVAPVFQTFGQGCSEGDKQYWLPTVEQLHAILARWDQLTPRPPLEVSYSWGRQEEWACPSLADASGGAHPDLQSVMKARNTKR